MLPHGKLQQLDVVEEEICGGVLAAKREKGNRECS